MSTNGYSIKILKSPHSFFHTQCGKHIFGPWLARTGPGRKSSGTGKKSRSPRKPHCFSGCAASVAGLTIHFRPMLQDILAGFGLFLQYVKAAASK